MIRADIENISTKKKEGGTLMHEYDSQTAEGPEDIKARLLKLIEAIEEKTEEIDYPLYCF